jgi:hypothetical protein
VLRSGWVFLRSWLCALWFTRPLHEFQQVRAPTGNIPVSVIQWPPEIPEARGGCEHPQAGQRPGLDNAAVSRRHGFHGLARMGRPHEGRMQNAEC